MRRSKRIIFKIKREAIKLVKLVNRPQYNKLFYQLLCDIGVNMGGEKPRFISDDVYLDDMDYSLLSIGARVTISKGVTLLVHDFSVTQPLTMKDANIIGACLLKPIVLNEGCFIGANCIILPGTNIGKNTIVGAGSVVKGNIPDNVVVVGNPARIVKSLDDYATKIIENEMPYIRLWEK